jgi:polyhydroxyalkanoate synthesis repressor PhaR
MVTIKRYNNRKLYDTGTKQYISLDDVAEMVRAGEEVRIIDHDSGDDITTLTLFQILFEEEKRIGGLMPEIMLTRIIRSGNEALAQFKKAFSRPASPAVRDEVDLEIERRIQLLVLGEQITPEEGARLMELLTNQAPQPMDETPTEAEEHEPAEGQPDKQGELIAALMEQLDRLEAELEEIRKSE